MGPEVSGTSPDHGRPYRKSDPIRILVSGTDFRYGFFGPVCGTDFGTNKSSGPKNVQRTVQNQILYQKSVQRTVPIRTDGRAVHGPDSVQNLDFLCPDFLSGTRL